MILEQHIDAAGKTRILWQFADGSTIFWKFDTTPTAEQLSALDQKYSELRQYESITRITTITIDNIDLIREFVTLVKRNPTVNLTQFNNWLATKTWYEDAQIRHFIFKLATGLADRKDITLSDYTQQEVLLRVRNWIVNTPVKTISKVVLGNITELGE